MKFSRIVTSERRLCVALALVLSIGLPAQAANRVQFNRDIRPILADNCFACHGPDKNTRKAGLRLDMHDSAVMVRDGRAALVPGKPNSSELLRRVATTDPDDLMPPSNTGKKLTERQKTFLRDWIQQGAPWEGHWSYLPPEPTAPPSIGDRAWRENPVDRFIMAKLKSQGLKSSPEADRITLIRRLSFDLTGLPPGPEDVDAFVKDRSPDAYTRLADRLLASPHYGERMAVQWLDLVRYGDTVGYHGDQTFSIFPYRDYVIRAFNKNLPFDRFTREQIAGDLLPGAGLEQKIASGYNRLNMMTAEGGAQDKEYRVKYMADRVRNASSVWLGATMGCAECHDHKFDPYTAKDFYSFAAFFADLKEKGFYDRGYPHGDWGPSVQVPTPEQENRLAEAKAEIARLKSILDTQTSALEIARAQWEQNLAAQPPPRLGEWQMAGPFTAASFDQAFDKVFPAEKEPAPDAADKDGQVRWTPKPEFSDGQVHELQGDNSATYLRRTIQSDGAQMLALSLGSDDAIKVWLNGKPVFANKANRAVAPDQDQVNVALPAGESRLLLKIVNAAGGYGFYFRPVGNLPVEILAIVKTPTGNRTTAQQQQLAAYHRSIAPELEDTRTRWAAAQSALEAIDKKIPTSLISEATDPRVMRVLPRGNWMSDDGDIVQPAVPHFLPQAAAEHRLTRLDLANWMVSAENPLTARVFVNRLWKLCFGTGLSKHLDDLGAQGEWPTHPELLDWLATEFHRSGWDVKHMVRLLVTSRTYRQSSLDTPRLREADPFNRFLARQTRFRLDAEFVRDNALSISGLLVPTVGGPSVRPYQPAGFYTQLNFPKRDYQADTGDSQYRRGLYTHWQRTFLHPSLSAFDAPTREECTVERIRSNTPQQALTLLNDPTYVEAARVFAARIVKEGGALPSRRMEFAFQQAMSRKPRPDELQLLTSLYDRNLQAYQADPDSAAELLKVGHRTASSDIPAPELAAWTSVARVVLNLHETITRN